MTVTFIAPGTDHGFAVWAGRETPLKEDVVTLVSERGESVRAIITRREWFSPVALVCTVQVLP